jgi:glycosyltransferase involved in cell wall biosynthesis
MLAPLRPFGLTTLAPCRSLLLMKIGFDISAQSLPRSGVGQYQINLLQALLNLDKDDFFNLYAFNFRNRKRFKRIHFSSDNYKIHALPVPQRLITAWWLMADFPSLERVAGDCDLYQVSEICIPPVKRAKTVAFIHDLTTILYPQHHVKSNVFLHNRRFKNIHKVDAVLTNSEHTKKDIVNYLKVKPDKIFVTYLGASDRFRPMEDSEAHETLKIFNLNSPYILFTGTLEPRKNVKTLIRAFNILKSKYSIPHRLVITGQRGWLYDDALKEIHSSPFRGHITELGYISDNDLPAIMNGADVFAYPSFYEGFGLPVLEAMKCGTPVITSNVSSLPEVGGDACVYISPEDPDGLAKRLFEVISDKKLKSDLSTKGIARAGMFSWEKCAKETINVYRLIAGK